MKIPLVIINFKTYSSAVGSNAVKLAKICERVAKKTKKNIAVVVNNTDLYRIAKAVSIPVFSQHIDPVEYGAYTGHIVPGNVKENGASGVLINHSEKKLSLNVIKKTVERAKQTGLITVVCASTPAMVEKVAKFKPDFIAVEPPELIGGDISVSKAKPDIIIGSLDLVGKIPLLCGAGIKTKEDIEIALALGAKGILLASGVTKAENPEEVLMGLLEGVY